MCLYKILTTIFHRIRHDRLSSLRHPDDDCWWPFLGEDAWQTRMIRRAGPTPNASVTNWVAFENCSGWARLYVRVMSLTGCLGRMCGLPSTYHQHKMDMGGG